MKPWHKNPEDYGRAVFCESCDIELEDCFVECPKCKSTSKHFVKFTKKLPKSL